MDCLDLGFTVLQNRDNWLVRCRKLESEIWSIFPLKQSPNDNNNV